MLIYNNVLADLHKLFELFAKTHNTLTHSVQEVFRFP